MMGGIWINIVFGVICGVAGDGVQVVPQDWPVLDGSSYGMQQLDPHKIPEDKNGMKEYAKKMWDVLWNDYKITRDRLQGKISRKWGDWESKMNEIAKEMFKGSSMFDKVDEMTTDLSSLLDRKKKIWEADDEENAKQLAALAEEYTDGYNTDAKASAQKLARAKNRGLLKLNKLIQGVNTVKEDAIAQRETIMKRAAVKEKMYKNWIERIAKERESYLDRADKYDERKKKRMLKTENGLLDDALGLSMRVKATMADMYKEVGKAADKVLSVVAKRMKFVDQADGAARKKEEQGMDGLESQTQAAATAVVDMYVLALKTEEEAMAKMEEKMDLEMRVVSKDMESQFSSIQRDLDSTDTALENGLLKVEGAESKVHDAVAQLNFGKDNMEKVLKKFKEGIAADADAAKTTFDSGLNDLKTDLSMSIQTQKQRAQAQGMKKLNEENQAVKQSMESFASDEDKRIEMVKEEIGKAKAEESTLSNTTETYATYVKGVVENTTAARGTIDEMKGAAMEEISAQNVKLDADITAESKKVQFKMDMVDPKVQEIEATTSNVIKEMMPTLKSKWLADIPALRIKVNREIEPVDESLEEWKTDIGGWLKLNLDKIQNTVEKTGTLINLVIPELQKTGKMKAEVVLEDVVRIEDALKQGSAAALIKAADDEHKLGSEFTETADNTAHKLLTGLADDKRKVKKWSDEMGAHIDERKGELSKSMKKMEDSFKGSLDGSHKVAVEISGAILKMKNSIAALKARAGALSGKEDQLKDLDKLLEDATSSLHQALDLQASAAKETMEKYSARVAADTEKREHAVTSGAAESSAAATKALMTVEDRYNDLFGKAFEDLRILTARMQQIPANEEEWAKGLSDTIKDAAGDAQEFEQLVGKSKLEQQAAIDAKFRGVSELLETKVHGMADSKRAVLAKLTLQAKKEMERAVHQGKLTGEQLADRMKKLMGWLDGQVVHSKDAVGEALISVNNTEEFWGGVEAESEARSQSLLALVGREDAAAGVQHNRDELAQTHATLEELIEGLTKSVDEAKVKAEADTKDMEGSHSFHALQIKSEFKSRATQATGSMEAEENAQKDELLRTQQSLEQNQVALNTEADKMTENVKQFDSRAYQKMEALGAQTIDREKATRRAKRFVESLQVMAADTLANAAAILVDMLNAGKHHIGAQANDVAMVAKNLEVAMGSEHVQVLQGLGRVDARLDAMLERNQKRHEEQEEIAESQSKWRTDVASVVDSIGGSLGIELTKLRAQGLGFEKTVKDDAAGMSADEKATVDDIGNAVTKTIEQDELNLASHALGFDKANGARGTVEGKLVNDAGGQVGEDTKGEQEARDALANGRQNSLTKMAQAQQADEQADKDLSAFVGKKTQDANVKRAQLKNTLNSMAHGSLAQMYAGQDAKAIAAKAELLSCLPNGCGTAEGPPPSEEIAAALSRNAQLLAEHSLLEKRLHHLTSEHLRSVEVH